MEREIASRQNPNFRRWLKLLDSRGAKKTGQFLIMGRKVVPEVLAQRPVSFLELIAPSGFAGKIPGTDRLKTYHLGHRLFRELDMLGTDFPILVAELPRLATLDFAKAPEGLELVTALSDPGNLGALIRSAEAFGASKVVLTEESVFPFHYRVIKASSGSVLRLPLMTGPSIQELSGEFVVLDLAGEALPTFEWPKNVRLVLGEEGRGIPPNLKGARRVSIPMVKSVESLNALVAASLAMYSYKLQTN